MLNLSACTIIETRPVEVASGIASIQEGSALVYVLENGFAKAKPSAGTSGEFYLGAALGNPVIPTKSNRVETVKVPASSPYTVQLSRAIAAGDPLVVVEPQGANARVVLAKAGAASATEYAISGQTVTVHSSFAGRTITLQYPYAISYAEAIQGPMGFDSNRMTDLASVPALGAIAVGEIFTDMYDPVSDWSTFSSSKQVRLGAGGIYTLEGSGTVLSAVVTALPSAANGLLGLRIPSY